LVSVRLSAAFLEHRIFGGLRNQGNANYAESRP
jgi:hypothetical protein